MHPFPFFLPLCAAIVLSRIIPFIFVIANLVKPSGGAGNSRFVPALLPVQPFPLRVPLAGTHQASSRLLSAATDGCKHPSVSLCLPPAGRRAAKAESSSSEASTPTCTQGRSPGPPSPRPATGRSGSKSKMLLPLASLRSAATRGTFLPSRVASKISAFRCFGALGSHLHSAYV